MLKIAIVLTETHFATPGLDSCKWERIMGSLSEESVCHIL